MAQLYRHLFEVRREAGLPRAFPLDMLRYDHCIPATSEDVTKIIDSLEGYKNFEESEAVTIRLSAYWEKSYKPKRERWQSFGWTFVLGSLETAKM